MFHLLSTHNKMVQPLPLALSAVHVAWLLLDSRVVDVSRSSNPIVVTFFSTNPFFFNGFEKAVHFSGTVGAEDPESKKSVGQRAAHAELLASGVAMPAARFEAREHDQLDPGEARHGSRDRYAFPVPSKA